MKLTKQDLMRLPKERLAEIIVEMQEPLTLTTPEKDVPHFIPFQDTRPLCYEPGGQCTNPMRDCINCPRQPTIGINTTTGTSISKLEEKK